MVMKRILFPVLVAVLGFCSPAAAQSDRNSQIITRPVTAEDVREDLRQILNQYPHSVGEILRRDPTLMARPDYMASYPDLVAYLQGHPEIPRNVEFYFDGYGSWQNQRQLDPSFEALGSCSAHRRRLS
jgi:hypothetical protein